MNKQQLKEKLEQFRQWQEQPYDYTYSPDKEVHCNNCGHDYRGNFCPVCSQKAGMGRIGWRSVHQGIMDIWGLGTRSLIYSVWQLLLRPGHIISDYIDGKRQVSFPPVKMLFILAVLYTMIYYWFIPTVLGINVETQVTKEQEAMLGDLSHWLKANYSWFALIMALLAVIPTWIMFRYSPRHTAHSLPEGFFIQVFLAVLMIVLSFLLMPLGMIDLMVYSTVVYLLYGVYYIIVYKYLFGYSLWGTLWRSGFVLTTVLFLLTAAIFLASNINQAIMEDQFKKHVTQEQILQAKLYSAGGILAFTTMVMAVGYVINMIVTRKFRKQIKQEKLRTRTGI